MGRSPLTLAEVYGASVSKATITTITDKMMEGMAEWSNRPLDRAWVLLVVANALRAGRGYLRRSAPSPSVMQAANPLSLTAVPVSSAFCGRARADDQRGHGG